jgi:hypothetical protein
MLATRIYRFLLRRRFKTRVAPHERIVVVTRSMNDTLYVRSQAMLTLPYARRKITGMNHWRHAANYLHVLFEFDVDWVINLDEDCFVFDESKLAGLLAYMQREDFDFCGIPDGGACIHRFHNPLVTNPFFNIFNVRKIRPKLHASNMLAMARLKHTPDLEVHAPRHLLKDGHKWAFDNFECFYGFFFWLLSSGFKPLYLPSIELDDGLTTELRDHENVPFAYHTWFARSYGVDDDHTQRINDVYKKAATLRGSGQA